MLNLINSARMSTTTTGTGTVDLNAAVSGYATFAEAGAVSGCKYRYTIEDGTDFEHGIGTYTDAATDTFSRDTVYLSKISGTAGTSKKNLSGSAQIYISALAEDFTDIIRDININAIRNAKALGASQPIIGGVAEGYGGTDGVNAGASSNYTLDTTNKRVLNTTTAGSETMISAGAGTNITDHFTTRTSAAFDGTTSQAVGVTADGANGISIGRIGKDYGGSPQIVTGLSIYGASDGGYLNGLTTVTIILKASNTDPTTTSWAGTTIGSITPFSNTNATNNKTTLGNANTTAYRYVWAEISGTNTRWVAEAQFYETPLPTINNMTVAHNGYDSLDAVPTVIQVGALIEPVDAATLNTDATFEVSRDNGTTWTSATMVQIQTIGTKVYVESAPINVTAQPSGSKPAVRYKTFNNKRVYGHGTVLRAA